MCCVCASVCARADSFKNICALCVYVCVQIVSRIFVLCVCARARADSFKNICAVSVCVRG